MWELCQQQQEISDAGSEKENQGLDPPITMFQRRGAENRREFYAEPGVDAWCLYSTPEP